MEKEELKRNLRNTVERFGGEISCRKLVDFLCEKYSLDKESVETTVADIIREAEDEVPGKHASLVRESNCWIRYSAEKNEYYFVSELELTENECKYLVFLFLKEFGGFATNGIVSSWIYRNFRSCIASKTIAIAPSRSGETKLDQQVRNIISHCREKEAGPVFFEEGFWIVKNKMKEVRNKFVFSAYSEQEL